MMEQKVTLWARVKRAVIRVLPQGQFARNVYLLAGGTALGQAVTVLVSPILTRLYSPEDFGVFGVYASVLGIIVVIASFRYEYAIPLPKEDATATNLLALCFALLLGTTTLAWIAMHLLGSQIVTWANVPGLKPYLWLIPIGILGEGTYQILSYWTLRRRDFLRMAWTRGTRGVGRAAVQVGVGLVNPAPLGLLLGQLAGDTAGSASLGLAAWRKDLVSFKAVSLQGIRRAGIRYRRFPLLSSWGSLLDALGANMPQVLLAAFYGAQVSGWFALGQRVIAAPLDIVIDSVSQVYFGEAAQLLQDEPKSVQRRFLKLTGRLALIGGGVVVMIWALGPWSFTLVFGPEWQTAGRYVQMLGLMYGFRFATAPLSHTLNILERQYLLSSWQAIRMVLGIGALVLAKVTGIPHIGAVMIYSISMAIAYVVLWLISWYELTKQSIRRNAE